MRCIFCLSLYFVSLSLSLSLSLSHLTPHTSHTHIISLSLFACLCSGRSNWRIRMITSPTWRTGSAPNASTFAFSPHWYASECCFNMYSHVWTNLSWRLPFNHRSVLHSMIAALITAVCEHQNWVLYCLLYLLSYSCLSSLLPSSLFYFTVYPLFSFTLSSIFSM